MPDVFLSYKREDLKAATRLVKALRGAGIEVWWDRDIPPGAPWEATIEKALAEASVVLVCWSKASVASDNVRSEARWAREQGRLIQLFVEPCDPPLFFGERQGVDLADWPGSRTDPKFKELTGAIRARLAEPLTGSARAVPLAPVQNARIGRLQMRAPLLAVVGAILIALAFGLLIWAARDELPVFGPEANRIAILPFATQGAGEDVGAFVAGLTGTLQNVLSDDGMPTVSSADALTLRGSGRDSLARRLGVRLILDGDAGRDGVALFVRAHLDDAGRHVTLWSAELSGAAAQPAALQAQAGARIIAVLNCSSRALRPNRGLSDPAALTLLLKACDLFEAQVGSGDDLQSLTGMLDAQRELTRKAPYFAAGHSALAKYLAVYRYAFPPDAQPQLLAEAQSEARKALAIDPNDEDGRLVLYILMPGQDLIGRDKAVMSLPSDPAWPYADIFKGAFLEQVGRLRESLLYTQRAVAANPLSVDTTSDTILAWNGQINAAKQELARLERLWPETPLLWGDRMVVDAESGDLDAMQATLDDPKLRARSMTEADVTVVRRVIEAARTHSPASMARAREALLHAQLAATNGPGGRVEYLAWLGFLDDAFVQAARFKRTDIGPFFGTEFLFAPETASMRRDPRFMPLAAKLGLVDYWRSSGAWPDFCSDQSLPYECKVEAAKAGRPRGGA